jgi:lysyl-tRNA synthetase class 2
MKESSYLLDVRYQKLNQLKEKNIDPFGERFERSHTIEEILKEFAELEQKKQRIKIAGRIISIRQHGKACFAHLKEATGKIQIYVKQDILGKENFKLFSKLDLGDYIGIKGNVFITKKGEKTIWVEEFKILCKSLRSLPKEWYGLKDVEVRYRQRYVDLLVNDDVKKIFIMRSKIVSGIRRFLESKGFLEVETPMMQTFAGGALARPFVTYHNTLNMQLYLRIAPELYLKRLVVGGLEKVFELNRNFRNEGISTRHNPEFTMLEVYEAYADYTDMMRLSEELICWVAENVLGSRKLIYQHHEIDLSPPWKRMSAYEAIEIFTKTKFRSLKDAKEAAKNIGLKVEPEWKDVDIFDELLEEYVCPNLIEPTFLTDFPTVISPLAKKKKDNPEIVERFEIFIAGQEIGNAYSELNDPIEQRQRFYEQNPDTIDEDYIRALEYGLPPTGGLGIGIDRLVMVLTNTSTIRDVILFPHLRPQTK